MKVFRTLFSCSLLLLCCGVAAMAQSVQTDYDRSFNLGKLRTYAFINQERGLKDPLAAVRSMTVAFTTR